MPPPSQSQRPPSPSLDELAELPLRFARLEAEGVKLRETLRTLEIQAARP